MDPLLDEKIILTLNRITTEFFKENLYLSADKEAYGPSRNAGLCYESCSRIGFSGDINGYLYFCLDGYTKLKLLPRIAQQFQIDAGLRGMADSIVLEFSNQLASNIVFELQDGGFNVDLEPPENLNHQLVRVDGSVYRQYIMIFFLRDRRERRYYGRLYLILTVRKFPEAGAAGEGTGAGDAESGDEDVADEFAGSSDAT